MNIAYHYVYVWFGLCSWQWRRLVRVRQLRPRTSRSRELRYLAQLSILSRILYSSWAEFDDDLYFFFVFTSPLSYRKGCLGTNQVRFKKYFSLSLCWANEIYDLIVMRSAFLEWYLTIWLFVWYRKEAEVNMEGHFLVRQIYDDDVTYNIVGAAERVLSE